MIQITDYAQKIADLLNERSFAVSFYKISIRLNFILDVLIISKDVNVYNETYFKNEIERTQHLKISQVKFAIRVLSELDEDNTIESAYSQNSTEISYSPSFRLGTLLRPKGKSKIATKTPIVTFYSYKGGMGRTTTMMSYAISLAHKGKKVFVIDCDLEAPGYLNFFDLSKHQLLAKGDRNGLVEYLCDIQFSRDSSKIDLNQYFINIRYRNENEEIDFNNLENIYLMPAGNLNEAISTSSENSSFPPSAHRQSYLEGLSRLNISDELTMRKLFTTLFDNISKIEPDVILVDSRTGFNDIIGTAILYFTDVFVGFFGNNNQTIPGLYSMLDTISNKTIDTFIINSILPSDTNLSDSLFLDFKNLLIKYVSDNHIQIDTETLMLHSFPLRRNSSLEKIGTLLDKGDYLHSIYDEAISDYRAIFESLDQVIFTTEDQNNVQPDDSYTKDSRIDRKKEAFDVSNVDTWSIRNRILQNLKSTLSNIKTFAEGAEIREDLFFYRNCMNQLFDSEKFLIRGYKGTGKTYLYKALALSSKEDSSPTIKNIANNILKRANKQLSKDSKDLIDTTCTLKFIDVLSIGGSGPKSFDFMGCDVDNVSNPNYYFKRIWQIYAWNSILLDEQFSSIRETSELKDEVLEIKGDESVERFQNLIQRGIKVFVEIEKDMKRVNQFLQDNNIKLFLLYDQLDSKIEPKYWDKVVSPLISYWRDNWNVYGNIFPKIFVRTDLFNRIMGTNTALLSENIINIEWSIDEIFCYFFKLVLSQDPNCFWEIMRRVGRTKASPDSFGKYKSLIPDYQKELAENNNQFTPRTEHLIPLVKVFFGNKVVAPGQKSGKDLGTPYEYFKTTLANADNVSISLRPFINTLDKNAVERALEELIPDRYVQSIISSKIYAQRSVRIQTANTYFEDLTRDPFSADMDNLRQLLWSADGENYRFKSLQEDKFYDMIQHIMNKYKMQFVQNDEDFITMIRANGIIAEKIERGEKLYRFAPMYIYAWKLQSTKYDKRDSKSYMYDADDDD